MARWALLVLCFVGLASAFNPATDDLTPEIAAKSLNLALKFKEYIPATIINEIEDILKPENADEIANLVNLRNQYRKGELQVKLPQTREEALELMKQYAPKTHERCVRVLNDFLEKYNKLSPEAKKFCDDSEARMYELHSTLTDPKDVSAHILAQINFAKEQDKRFHALPTSVRGEFQKQWPEIIKFMNSPMYTQGMHILKNTDPKKIGQLFEGMMALANRARQQN